MYESPNNARTSAAGPHGNRLLLDFADKAATWVAVNDPVMGGRSRGELRLSDDQTGIFAGELSAENGGGFSSVRIAVDPIDPSRVRQLRARVLGDGRGYQIRLRSEDVDEMDYSARFTPQAGTWETVVIARSDFEPVYRGRRVDAAPPWMASSLCEVGVLIADQQYGRFRLEIDWVRID